MMTAEDAKFIRLIRLAIGILSCLVGAGAFLALADRWRTYEAFGSEHELDVFTFALSCMVLLYLFLTDPKEDLPGRIPRIVRLWLTAKEQELKRRVGE